MATDIPPHNAAEVCEAALHLIKHRNATFEKILDIGPGPDFPTGGIIISQRVEIAAAYRTGRGRMKVRARANIETVKNGRENIILSELPYQVNKANLQEKIVELVRDRKIEGISDVRDESDRDGIRLVIELKRDAVSEVILNQLYKHTQMQVTFGAIMLALVDGAPKVLNLKEILQHFVEFRHEVVVLLTTRSLRSCRRSCSLVGAHTSHECEH